MEKKFKRGKDKQVAGVCSGIAEYFDLDVTLVRVICIILCLFCTPALFIYIILAIVSLEEDNDDTNDDNYEERIDEYNAYEDYSEEDELISTTTVNNSFEKTKHSNSNNPFEL